MPWETNKRREGVSLTRRLLFLRVNVLLADDRLLKAFKITGHSSQFQLDLDKLRPSSVFVGRLLQWTSQPCHASQDSRSERILE